MFSEKTCLKQIVVAMQYTKHYIPVIAVYWQIVVIYPATLSLISFYATITKNLARLKELE